MPFDDRWSRTMSAGWWKTKLEPVFAGTDPFLRYLTDDVPEEVGAVARLLRRAAALAAYSRLWRSASRDYSVVFGRRSSHPLGQYKAGGQPNHHDSILS